MFNLLGTQLFLISSLLFCNKREEEDIDRAQDDKSADAFNMIGIDTEHKLLRVLRIGSNYAAIRSATDDGGVVTPNTITNIQVIDRDTSQVLFIDNQPHASSASSTDYTFAIDISQWFTAATTRRLQVIATDDEGDHASRTINVVAVDVTVESVQVLNYAPASVVFTTDSVKSLPMFRFPNNQGISTSQGEDRYLVSFRDIQDGEWGKFFTASEEMKNILDQISDIEDGFPFETTIISEVFDGRKVKYKFS